MTSNVSFIIPAFNCADTLEASVESIVNGNLDKADEIVIVDDASTDSTKSIIESLQTKYGFINCISHTANKGGAGARNTAVRNARYDLIFCLDSDNLLVPGTVPTLKKFMVAEEADIASFQILSFFRRKYSRVTHRWVFKPGLHHLCDCLAGPITPIASGNYLFTKKSWQDAEGYPEGSQALDAWGFGLRQVATGAKLRVLPNSHYYHRFGHASYWVRSSQERDIIAYEILKPFFNLLREEDVRYIEQNKDSWFSTLSEHPIRVCSSNLGTDGYAVYPSHFQRLLRRFLY